MKPLGYLVEPSKMRKVTAKHFGFPKFKGFSSSDSESLICYICNKKIKKYEPYTIEYVKGKKKVRHKSC